MSLIRGLPFIGARTRSTARRKTQRRTKPPLRPSQLSFRRWKAIPSYLVRSRDQPLSSSFGATDRWETAAINLSSPAWQASSFYSTACSRRSGNEPKIASSSSPITRRYPFQPPSPPLFFPPLSPLLDVRSVFLNTSHTLKVIAHLCRFRYRLLLDPWVPCAFFRKPALFSSSECHHRCRSWGYFQLDGGTAVKQRQNLVDQFNNPFASECTVTSFATMLCEADLLGTRA